MTLARPFKAGTRRLFRRRRVATDMKHHTESLASLPRRLKLPYLIPALKGRAKFETALRAVHADYLP